MMRLGREAAERQPAGTLAKLRADGDGEVTSGVLFSAARAGDPDATQILRSTAGHLARGILNGVNLFDPEAVIIGGGVADADTSGIWLDAVRRAIHAQAFSVEGQSLRIGKAALGNDAGFIGAAALGALMPGG